MKKTTNKNSIKYQHVYHSFGPLFNADSKILILGSMPSVLSRQVGFFYGHPQNRFWEMLAKIFVCSVPTTIADKKKLALDHDIALFDVIAECDIIGSSDASIKNVVPNDIAGLIEKTSIVKIVLNGKKAASLFFKYIEVPSGISVVVLPSTSPANAALSLDNLVGVWSKEIRL